MNYTGKARDKSLARYIQLDAVYTETETKPRSDMLYVPARDGECHTYQSNEQYTLKKLSGNVGTCSEYRDGQTGTVRPIINGGDQSVG
jgi:hypothetical protein